MYFKGVSECICNFQDGFYQVEGQCYRQLTNVTKVGGTSQVKLIIKKTYYVHTDIFVFNYRIGRATKRRGGGLWDRVQPQCKVNFYYKENREEKITFNLEKEFIIFKFWI